MSTVVQLEPNIYDVTVQESDHIVTVASNESTTTIEEQIYSATVSESVYTVTIGAEAAPTTVTLQLVAGEALTAGDAISVSAAGQAVIADTSTASGRALVIGFVESNTLVNATASIQVFGRATVRFAVAPIGADIGKEVFLSTAGLVTLTPPVSSGTTLSRVGILLATTPEIDIAIETRADIP